MEPQFSTVALDPIKESEITVLLKTFAPGSIMEFEIIMFEWIPGLRRDLVLLCFPSVDWRISSPKIMRPDKVQFLIWALIAFSIDASETDEALSPSQWYNKYTIDQSSLEQPFVSRISISWGETVRSMPFEFLKLGKMVSHVFWWEIERYCVAERRVITFWIVSILSSLDFWNGARWDKLQLIEVINTLPPWSRRYRKIQSYDDLVSDRPRDIRMVKTPLSSLLFLQRSSK